MSLWRIEDGGGQRAGYVESSAPDWAVLTAKVWNIIPETKGHRAELVPEDRYRGEAISHIRATAELAPYEAGIIRVVSGLRRSDAIDHWRWILTANPWVIANWYVEHWSAAGDQTTNGPGTEVPGPLAS